MVETRAKFGQHWRGDWYEKDAPMPANKEQSRRMTRAGTAYYHIKSEPKTETEPVDRNTEFDSIPSGDVLKKHFNTVNAVSFATDEDLLQIDGIGEKSLERIRAYFG